MKASITIHVETLWTNRAELTIEAELDNPISETGQEVVSLMFEAARLLTAEARGEHERSLFGQEATNARHREMDQREARLDERDKRVTVREATAATHDSEADRRDEQADEREREQMEQQVHDERES